MIFVICKRPCLDINLVLQQEFQFDKKNIPRKLDSVVIILGDIQILLFHLEEDLPPDHLHRATCSKGRTHCKQALLYHFSSIRWLWQCYNLNIECPVFVGYSEKEYLSFQISLLSHIDIADFFFTSISYFFTYYMKRFIDNL